MKKLLLGICIINFSLAFSQYHKIVYNFKFKTDSLSENYQTWEFSLFVSPTQSKFGLTLFEKIEKEIPVDISMSFTLPMQQFVTRNRNSDEFTNYDNIDNTYYSYTTTDPILWQITQETKKIEGHKLQKATTNFGGRNWIVWFSKETPINEGPFKFRGLPGLIYEVIDTKSNFHYQLTSIENLKEEQDTSRILETHFGFPPVKINLKKYKELILNNYLNPYAEFRTMEEGTWSIDPQENVEITTIAQLNEYSKTLREEIRRNNNPVELSKAVKFPIK